MDDATTQDADALAESLATALQTWSNTGVGQLDVKSYDIEGTPPVRPNGWATRSPGSVGVSSVPREVAICLSFNGGNNTPRERGRLYIPCPVFKTSLAADRPSASDRQKVADLVPIFAGLGGANVDWIVWSPSRAAATKVERWFVDDEWDVQRRRGLRAATRTSGTTGG